MRPNYKEIAVELSTTIFPKAEWKWAAYKQGDVYYFDTREQATSISSLVERVQVNVENYKLQQQEYRKEQDYIFQTWWNRVREYFAEYSEAELDIMYDYAYDRGHADGHDEVFSYMEDFSSIVDKFRELYKRD